VECSASAGIGVFLPSGKLNPRRETDPVPERRKHDTPAEEVAALRRHLIEKVPISDLETTRPAG
jgi:hypothetical protein